jgi:polysaccharide export outer membrane protein
MSTNRGVLPLLVLIVTFVFTAAAQAQTSSYEAYQKQYQNRLGVADTTTAKLLEQRQAIRAGYDAQAQEGPVDVSTYKLGPGDGVYLNVYAAHSLDQDLTITPEGRLIIPRTGQVDVSGLTVPEAEKKVNALLRKEYKEPDASLSLRKLRQIKITVVGDVLAPGIYSGASLSRVNELIDKAGGFSRESSLRNIEIRDQSGKLRTKADLVSYLVAGDLKANPLLEGGDVIVVPRVVSFVLINGSVSEPGQKEFVEGDRLSTIIKIAHGLRQDAITDDVEISRFRLEDGSSSERFIVNYTNGEDPEIKQGDVISIKGRSDYHVPKVVSVAGEVTNPGKYSIDRGKTRLLDVLSRAGGITSTGSLEEAVVLRRAGVGSWESDPEFIMIQQLANNPSAKLTDDQQNYYQARTRQLGRSIMVVDFKNLLEKGDTSQNIIMRDGDSVWVPRARGYISVIGSINNQGNVNYEPGRPFGYYIEKAGGYTSAADKSEVRVINSRTSTYIDPRSDDDYVIGPGDTIVIPAERYTFWEDVGAITALAAQVVTIIAGVVLLAK